MSETGEGPIRQARRPDEIKNEMDDFKLPSLKKQAAAAIVLAGAVIAANAGVEAIKNEEPHESKTLQELGYEIKVDQGKYKVTWEKDGNILNINETPRVATLGERESGETVNIALYDITAINGTPWDGESDIILKNSPILMDIDPSNGQLEAPWFVLDIDLKNSNKKTGFISHSSATDDFIEKVKDGEIVKYDEDANGNGFGIDKSGEKIPNDQIGKVKVVSDHLSS